jgi:hypothetical protein
LEQALGDRLGAVVVKAHAVDDRTVFGQPEQADGIALLRAGNTVPISTKPKPIASIASGTSPFLSKPGPGQPDWERDARHALRQRRGKLWAGPLWQHPQRRDRHAMRRFCGKLEQERAEEAIGHLGKAGLSLFRK